MYMIAEVSQYVAVASFAEAWIEIDFATLQRQIDSVAFFAEAWIEIKIVAALKTVYTVASFAEAWIEISDCPPNELNDKHPIKQSLLYKKIKIIVNVAKKYSP